MVTEFGVHQPAEVGPGDMPRRVQIAAVYRMLAKGGVKELAFQQRLSRHPRADELASMLDDPDFSPISQIMSESTSITWAECNRCGLGRFVSSAKKQSDCNLTVGCSGKLCVGKAVVAVSLFGELPAAAPKSSRKSQQGKPSDPAPAADGSPTSQSEQ